LDASKTLNDEELEKLREEKLKKMQTTSKGSNTPSVMSLTDSTFKETINKYPLIVVDFWAPWCGPCRIVGPIVEELAEELKGKVAFGKLNVDEYQKTSREFHVFSIPTLAILKNGVEVDRIIGAVPKKTIKAQIEKYLS